MTAPSPAAAQAWLDILKSAIAVITPVCGGAWFVIKQYGAMQERLRTAQAQVVTASVDALKAELVESKATQKDLATHLHQTREQLVQIKTHLGLALRSEIQFGRRVDDMREIFDRRVTTVENTLEHGQLVKEDGAVKFKIKQKG